MPKGIYKRTKEHLEILNRARKKSIEVRKRGILSMRGENNPSKRPEVRKKISIANKGHKGAHYKHTKEAKKKIRKYNLGKKLSEITKEKIRKKRLHQVFPVKDTSIEIKMQDALKNENINFETHKPIFGQPDVFIKPNICIFCDGDYWHNLPNYKKRDKIVNKYLLNKRYIVLRFWEHEINNNINNCISKIKLSYVENNPSALQGLSMKQEATSFM